MWIVRIALRRPYTFVVMAMLIALGGAYSIKTTPTDIFPTIDIPVISVIFNYAGLPPEEMERRVTTNFERFLTTVVSDIDHMESQTLTGISITKVYLQPGASTAIRRSRRSPRWRRPRSGRMPPGMVPPLIMRYSATSVPIMMLAMESDTLSEQQLFDYGINFIRAEIAVVPGTQVPYPYGGRQRFIMIDIDPPRLQAAGISARDVDNALASQDVILPSGTAKIGANEYPVIMGTAPETLADIGAFPIKSVNGRTIYIRDVASVRDGNTPQTNMVHVEGHRSVLMPVLKIGDASTLDVVKSVKAALPHALERLPKEAQGHLHVKVLFDQSVFVAASIQNVLHEGLIAAGLTALMILVFLGSWRSTLVVITSIPLAILFAIIALRLLGQTLNVMTLGGLALAIGVLVDDATRRDREHPSQQGQARDVRADHPRRRAADRGPGVRVDDLHLHRVRADRVPDRRREVAVRAARAQRRDLDADVVPVVAHARADDGPLPARAREDASTIGRTASPSRSIAGSRACATATAVCSGGACTIEPSSSSPSRCSSRARSR